MAGWGLSRMRRSRRGADGGQVAADVAHGDGGLEGGGEAAGGDGAGGGLVGGGDDGLGPGRGAALGAEADAETVGAGLELVEDDGGADEVGGFATALADGPGEVGLDGGGQLVDVVAVEAEAGFQAEAVAGAEAAGRTPGSARRCSASVSAWSAGTLISKPSSPE